jgi:hypothetical protein
VRPDGAALGLFVPTGASAVDAGTIDRLFAEFQRLGPAKG